MARCELSGYLDTFHTILRIYINKNWPYAAVEMRMNQTSRVFACTVISLLWQVLQGTKFSRCNARMSQRCPSIHNSRIDYCNLRISNRTACCLHWLISKSSHSIGVSRFDCQAPTSWPFQPGSARSGIGYQSVHARKCYLYKVCHHDVQQRHWFVAPTIHDCKHNLQ